MKLIKADQYFLNNVRKIINRGNVTEGKRTKITDFEIIKDSIIDMGLSNDY